MRGECGLTGMVRVNEPSARSRRCQVMPSSLARSVLEPDIVRTPFSSTFRLISSLDIPGTFALIS